MPDALTTAPAPTAADAGPGRDSLLVRACRRSQGEGLPVWFLPRKAPATPVDPALVAGH